MDYQSPKIKNEFTLIEILAVFMVIGILMSILLPAITKGRKKAQSITCSNNIKQQLLGLSLYADDYDGSMVSPLSNVALGTTWNLVLQLNDYVNESKGTNTFVCPVFEPYRYSDEDSSKIYGMRYVDDPRNASDPEAAWNLRHTNLSRIQDPSNYLLLGDSVLFENNHQWYVIDLVDSISQLKLQARHFNKAVCGFIDGSVRSMDFSELTSKNFNVSLAK